MSFDNIHINILDDRDFNRITNSFVINIKLLLLLCMCTPSDVHIYPTKVQYCLLFDKFKRVDLFRIHTFGWGFSWVVDVPLTYYIQKNKKIWNFFFVNVLSTFTRYLHKVYTHIFTDKLTSFMQVEATGRVVAEHSVRHRKWFVVMKS